MPWKSLVTDDQIVAKGTLDQLGRAEGCLAGLGNLKQLSEAAGTKSVELGRSPRRRPSTPHAARDGRQRWMIGVGW